MPGIAGIISGRPDHQCQRLACAMMASMKHEDFYTSGVHFAPEIGVYAGWIAHEKSFASGQVFFNEDRDVAILFSGECFPDPGVASRLRREGHFVGPGSGDWLVHLYEETGTAFFEQLNGLFSGLVIDLRIMKAFLFNDRYGAERIYWHEKDDQFYFASEAKALIRILPELRKFNQRAVADFLSYGCAVEGRTLFEGIELLPGGSFWSFKNGVRQERSYFYPDILESQSTLSLKEFASEFEATFKRVVPRYFASDSTIGISATGGLDSRMIMACLPETQVKPICYTFSGIEGRTRDDRLAMRVASTCGLEHEILRLGRDFFAYFATTADKTVYITDGSFGVTGAHEIYLNRRARDLATVRVTGNFGGEVLRRVSTFNRIGLSTNLFSPEMRRAMDDAPHSLAKGTAHPVSFAAFREIPWSLFGSMAAGRSQTIFRTPYLDNEIVALAYRCPTKSLSSPQAGFAVVSANNPDLSRIETDMGIGTHHSGLSGIVSRMFAKLTFKLDYINNDGLPHWLSPLDSISEWLGSIGIIGQHKYLHYRSWFRRELAHYLQDAMSDTRISQSWIWNAEFLHKMVKEHLTGRKNYVREIDAVLTLSAVERLLFRDVDRSRDELNDPGRPFVASSAIEQP